MVDVHQSMEKVLCSGDSIEGFNFYGRNKEDIIKFLDGTNLTLSPIPELSALKCFLDSTALKRQVEMLQEVKVTITSMRGVEDQFSKSPQTLAKAALAFSPGLEPMDILATNGDKENEQESLLHHSPMNSPTSAASYVKAKRNRLTSEEQQFVISSREWLSNGGVAALGGLTSERCATASDRAGAKPHFSTLADLQSFVNKAVTAQKGIPKPPIKESTTPRCKSPMMATHGASMTLQASHGPAPTATFRKTSVNIDEWLSAQREQYQEQRKTFLKGGNQMNFTLPSSKIF
jgi:hypothetical protein